MVRHWRLLESEELPKDNDISAACEIFQPIHASTVTPISLQMETTAPSRM